VRQAQFRRLCFFYCLLVTVSAGNSTLVAITKTATITPCGKSVKRPAKPVEQLRPTLGNEETNQATTDNHRTVSLRAPNSARRSQRKSDSVSSSPKHDDAQTENLSAS
jgi:hypothetical protein